MVLLSFHRWTGLILAPILVLAGLTGAILPYASELNRCMAPALWNAVPPTPGAHVLNGVDLLERVERQTGGTASYVRLSLEPDRAQAIFIEPRPGGPTLDCSEAIADPYLLELKKQTIPYGLHAFGRVPAPDAVASTVNAIVSVDRSKLPDQRKVIRI